MPTQAWQFIPIIPALERLRQEASEIKANLSYIVRSCHKKKQKANKKETYLYYILSSKFHS
jgi:hypothetical protein